MAKQEKILFLSEADVQSLLTQEEAIEAAADTFRGIGLGEITVGQMGLMFVDQKKQNNFHSMPAILHHKHTAGVKWISTYANPAPGFPFCHGTLVLLSDTITGSPIALMGATAITSMRTAGGHGVVQAKVLCNPNPKVLSLIGCGAQAKAGIRGFLTAFPSIRTIRIFSRSRGPMEEIQRQIKERAETVICDNPESTLEGSNLLLMASGAQQPLITWEMLKPGTTVIGIEGFRDMDVNIGKKANKWYLGYKKPDEHILLSGKLNPGHILKNEDVFGDMTELMTGKNPGREREDEIIVSTHMGMGAHDVNCAITVYQKAVHAGKGTWLSL